MTFKGIKRYGFEEKYILDYPNLEVKNSFSKLILEANYEMKNDIFEKISNIYIKIENNDIDGLMKELKRIISSVPYNLHRKEESYYHSLIFTILAAAGLDVKAEELTNLGMSDLVIDFDYGGENRVYLFEIKLDKDPNKAIEQIKEKKYYEKYLKDNNDIYLIGVNINSDKRNIDEYAVEKV